jgi:oligoribonuclease (3'-5' exoribonuclease)
MKYLSFDIEATGLEENAIMIEFALVPFDTSTRTIEHDLERHWYLKCPSFDELKASLNPWVVEHNEQLIRTAHKQGIELVTFKKELQNYLEDDRVKDYFGHQKIKLFGKSISAIDLPFLNRDLGWDWMNKYFHHRNLDLSCFCMGLVDLKILPIGCDSGNHLMKYFNMGEVSHTALEDAINTIILYFKTLDVVAQKLVLSDEHE